MEDAGFVREDDGLCSVVEVELGEDASDVRLHGGIADNQLLGNICVRQRRRGGVDGSRQSSPLRVQAHPTNRMRPNDLGKYFSRRSD